MGWMGMLWPRMERSTWPRAGFLRGVSCIIGPLRLSSRRRGRSWVIRRNLTMEDGKGPFAESTKLPRICLPSPRKFATLAAELIATSEATAYIISKVSGGIVSQLSRRSLRAFSLRAVALRWRVSGVCCASTRNQNDSSSAGPIEFIR